MANHLSSESSPYLLQHAANPVDWYPWGQEALDKARAEDKPIFLSIGYSACHWCHVMERESFEDQRTAALLNDRFVNIKVDREERPDLDAVYMGAVQALTGHGGWPLSAWLTPEGEPFFGGTYFPPAPRPGMPSFLQVLEAVSHAWDTRRGDLRQTAAAVRGHLARDAEAETELAAAAGRHAPSDAKGRPGRARILAQAADHLHQTLDRRNGGWGDAPKFPQPLVLEYLLASQTVEPGPELEHDITSTLDAMAAGGMYDHLGGGFHRYSTDSHWLVPHFEKMLYDNAQLARCYLHAWLLQGTSRYRTVATETLDYLLRDMRHPKGGFFSAEDADTAAGEGVYYTWTLDEVRGALPAEQAAAIEQTYGLTTRGNFEGRNILHLPFRPGADLADTERAGAAEGPSGAAGLPSDAGGAVGQPSGSEGASAMLAAARKRLIEFRDRRPRPARDEKIIAAWNGLALAAFSEAAVAFGSAGYREAAERAGEFILSELAGGNGIAGPGGPERQVGPERRGLFHSWKDGRVSGPGFLDDYACVAEGLLALYRCTLDERWFAASRMFVDDLVERFARAAGGFYDTSPEHETLIARPRATYDSPTATGNSMAASVLLKLAAYTGEDRYRRLAEGALDSLAEEASVAPVMAGQWLWAALLAEEGATEVAIVGDLSVPSGRALLATVTNSHNPLAVLAARPSGASSQIALLRDREPPPGASAVAWVCRHSTCAPPTSDPADLLRLISQGRRNPL
jgi:uncharacterized protein YyaL (SSP411 family)